MIIDIEEGGGEGVTFLYLKMKIDRIKKIG